MHPGQSHPILIRLRYRSLERCGLRLRGMSTSVMHAGGLIGRGQIGHVRKGQAIWVIDYAVQPVATAGQELSQDRSQSGQVNAVAL